MKTQNNKLNGFKVYEFYFKGSDKLHWGIAKSKKSLNSHYFNGLSKVHLRDDVEIDESLNFAPVIIDDKESHFGVTETTLEEFLND